MRDPMKHIPVVRRLSSPREDLYAFEIVGHVTQADIRNVYGLLEEAYAAHDEIDLLVRITDYEGFDLSAAFTQDVVAGKAKGMRHIRRYALIGGPDWIRVATRMFAPILPMQIRCFDLEDEEAAWAWLEADAGG